MNSGLPPSKGAAARPLFWLRMVGLAAATLALLWVVCTLAPVALPPGGRAALPTAASPLTVHLVPHSHLDAGWLRTFAAYYNDQGQPILYSVTHGLAQHADRRFTWADLAFLLRWLKQDHSRPIDSRLLENHCAQVHEVIRECVCGERANRNIEEQGQPPVLILHLVSCLILSAPYQLALVGGSYTAQDAAVTSPFERMEGFEYGRGEWAKWEHKMRLHVESRLGARATLQLERAPRAFAWGYEIDQFGHSASEPALAAGLDMDGMLMGRLEYPRHQAMKRGATREFWWPHLQAQFATEEDSETKTSSTWDEPTPSTTTRPLLTSVLHQHYSSPPCLHNLHQDTLVFPSRWASQSLFHLLDGFVLYLRERLVEQQTRHMLVLVGDDFRYQSRDDVERLYAKLDTLASALNQIEDPAGMVVGQGARWKSLLSADELAVAQDRFGEHHFKLRISTVADYMEAISSEDAALRASAPAAGPSIFPSLTMPSSSLTSSLSGDLFPYSDQVFDNVWTGYYSNVPWMKHRTRSLLARRRSVAAAVAAHTLTIAQTQDGATDAARHWLTRAGALRTDIFEPLLLNLHHDAITGTHRPAVRLDYLRQLSDGAKALAAMQAELGTARLAVSLAHLGKRALPTDDTALEYRSNRLKLRKQLGHIDEQHLTLKLKHLEVLWRRAHKHDDSVPLPGWLQGEHPNVNFSEDDLPPWEARPQVTPFLTDHDAIAASGAGQTPSSIVDIADMPLVVDLTPLFRMSWTRADAPDIITVSLFNPLSVERTEIMPLHVSMDCAVFPTAATHGVYPSLVVRDSDARILSPLRVQFPLEPFATSHCEGRPDLVATFVLHVEVHIKPLVFHTLHLSLGTDAASVATPPTDDAAAATTVEWTSNGVWLIGASRQVYVPFSTRNGQLEYTLMTKHAKGPSSGLSMRHSHRVYLSSVRPSSNSGAYLFRSLFPSSFGLFILQLALTWLVGALVCSVIFTPTMFMRGTNHSLPGAHSRPAPMRGNTGSASFKDTVKLQITSVSFFTLQSFRSRPGISHAVFGCAFAAFLVVCLLEDSRFLSHVTVLHLLSSEADSMLRIIGFVFGALHALLLVQAGADNTERIWDTKKEDDAKVRSGPPRKSFRSVFIGISSFALSFAVTAIFIFLALPSFQSRLLLLGELITPEAEATAVPSFVAPKYSLVADGPLFSELAYESSPSVWESIRVHRASPTKYSRVAWQNDLITYRWSVSPCANCELVARIRHDDTSGFGASQQAEQASYYKPASLDSIPASTSWLLIRTAASFFDGISDLLVYVFSSVDSSFWVSDDGVSAVPRRSPPFSAFLPSRYSPFQSAALLDSTRDDTSAGFSLLLGNQAFGGARMDGAFEMMHQRWLTRDDEKGLDYGLVDSVRYRHTAHILPHFAHGTSRSQHLARARELQLCVAQPILPLGVGFASNSVLAAAEPATSVPLSTLLASLPTHISLLSFSLHSIGEPLSEDELSLPLPLSLSAGASPSDSAQPALLYSLRVVSHRADTWSLSKACSWLDVRIRESESPAAANIAPLRRLSCPCWHRANLALTDLLPKVPRSRRASACGIESLALAPGEIVAVLVWVREL